MTLQKAILSRGLSNGTTPSRGYRSIAVDIPVLTPKQTLGISTTATVRIIRSTKVSATQTLGIKGEAKKAGTLNIPAKDTLGIKGEAKADHSTSRSVIQNLGINSEIHLTRKFANIVKSVYHVFRFKDATKHRFKEIGKTTRYRT